LGFEIVSDFGGGVDPLNKQTQLLYERVIEATPARQLSLVARQTSCATEQSHHPDFVLRISDFPLPKRASDFGFDP